MLSIGCETMHLTLWVLSRVEHIIPGCLPTPRTTSSSGQMLLPLWSHLGQDSSVRALGHLQFAAVIADFPTLLSTLSHLLFCFLFSPGILTPDLGFLLSIQRFYTDFPLAGNVLSPISYPCVQSDVILTHPSLSLSLYFFIANITPETTLQICLSSYSFIF